MGTTLDKNDGGPAFPEAQWRNGGLSTSQGMTMRDYFAAHASDGDIDEQLKRVPKVETVAGDASGYKTVIYGSPINARQIARYMHADAMIEERAK